MVLFYLNHNSNDIKKYASNKMVFTIDTIHKADDSYLVYTRTF